MKDTRIIMGMPITVEIVDTKATEKTIDMIFDYFTYVDNTFSTKKQIIILIFIVLMALLIHQD